MRFRAKRFDYHAEATNLLLNERQETTKIWIAASKNHDDEKSIEEEDLEDVEDVSDSDDCNKTEMREEKDFESSENSASPENSKKKVQCGDLNRANSQSSDESIGNTMEFDYGDDLGNFKSVNTTHDQLAGSVAGGTKSTRERKVKNPLNCSEFESALSCSPVEPKRPMDDTIVCCEQEDPDRQSSANFIAEATPSDIQKAFQNIAISFYEVPWLLEFISNIRRVANRRRLAMAPCRDQICLVSPRPAHPLDSVLPYFSAWEINCRAVSLRASNQLHTLQDSTLRQNESGSAQPYGPQGKVMGKFSTHTWGTTSDRREAFRRDQKALVVYRGATTSKRPVQLQPEMVPNVWQAAVTIAYVAAQSVMASKCKVPTLSSQCQEAGSRKRRVSSQSHTASMKGEESRASPQMVHKRRLKKPPVYSQQGQGDEGTNRQDNAIQDSSSGGISRATLKNFQETYVIKKKNKKKRKSSISVSTSRPSVGNRGTKKLRQTKDSLTRRIEPGNFEASHDDRIREKEAALLERFGLKVNESPEEKRRDGRVDEGWSTRPQTGRLENQGPSVVQNVSRIVASASPDEEFEQKASEKHDNFEVSMSSSYDNHDVTKMASITSVNSAASVAPLLRRGSPSSFDKVLTRQESQKVAQNQNEKSAPASCSARMNASGRTSHRCLPPKNRRRNCTQWNDSNPTSLLELFEEEESDDIQTSDVPAESSAKRLLTPSGQNDRSDFQDFSRDVTLESQNRESLQRTSQKHDEPQLLSSRSQSECDNVARIASEKHRHPVLSAAPPLRCGSPSSFDKVLKRQESNAKSGPTVNIDNRKGIAPPSRRCENAMSRPHNNAESLLELFEEEPELISPIYSTLSRHPESSADKPSKEMVSSSKRLEAAPSSQVLFEQKDFGAQTTSKHITPKRTMQMPPVVSLERESSHQRPGIESRANMTRIPRSHHTPQSAPPKITGRCSSGSPDPQQDATLAIIDMTKQAPNPPRSEQADELAYNKALHGRKTRSPFSKGGVDEPNKNESRKERKRLRKEEKKQKKRERKRMRKDRKRQYHAKRDLEKEISMTKEASFRPPVSKIDEKSSTSRGPVKPPVASMDSQHRLHTGPNIGTKVGEGDNNTDEKVSGETISTDGIDGVPAQVEPVARLLCSEAFIEARGEIVATLASGYWEPTVSQGEMLADAEILQTGPCRKIRFLDTSLLDMCGVDVELGGRGAIIVSSVSSWVESGSAPLLKRVVDIALASRYKFLEVFICVDTQFNDYVVNEISRLQNGCLRQGGCPATMMTLQVTCPDSLACCVGHAIMATEHNYSEEGFKAIETINSDLRAKERLLFLLSVAPSLSAGGAFKSIQLVSSSERDKTRSWFRRLLGASESERRRQQLLTRSHNKVRESLNPVSLMQISFAINVALGRNEASY